MITNHYELNDVANSLSNETIKDNWTDSVLSNSLLNQFALS